MNTTTCIGAASAALLLASIGSAQSYTDIVGFDVSDISADGTKLYGNDFNLASNVIYDIATGTILAIGEDRAVACNADGTTACGEIALTGNGGYWDGSSWTDIGTLNTMGLSCGGGSTPKDMSSDGSVLVGSDWPNVCTLDAYVWETATSGPIFSLPKLGFGSTRADCVSGDGLSIGGYERFTGSSNQAAIWQKDPVLGWLAPTLVLEGIDFGDGNLDGRGVVTVINESGTHAAIEAGLNSAPNVKLWNSNGTVTDLGPVPGFPTSRPSPTGITTDGKMIVGLIPGGFFGPPGTGFVWTQAGGMQAADSFLAAAGVPLPAAFASSSIDGCSADGKVIWGRAGAFPFFTTWLVELPAWNKYGVGVSPTNTLDLDASGSTSLSGGVLTLTTTGTGTAPFVASVVALDAANFAALGGIILVNPVIPSLQPPILLNVASGGTSVATLVMPSSASLAGLAFHVQSAAPDAAMPAGWALSNGLRAVLCP